MANYIKGARIGVGSASDGYEKFRNMFHGASEAPRVHGLTGDAYHGTPRFKNHYFVHFHYSDLYTPADQKGIIDITHRVKSIDAPRFDIETETLNQYNKPRIVPLKINYQPITITFWDDRSNLTTDFWNTVYQFYFLNGARNDPSQYPSYDSDITHINDGTSDMLGYDNYGYYIGDKKHNRKNLFAYMSLYLVANTQCNRIDLINPYMQQMQHDQFSQEMSNELAQNTVTWAYENVVYYDRTSITEDKALLGLVDEAGSIFQWSKPTFQMGADTTTLSDQIPPTGKEYTQTATGGFTAAFGKIPRKPRNQAGPHGKGKRRNNRNTPPGPTEVKEDWLYNPGKAVPVKNTGGQGPGGRYKPGNWSYGAVFPLTSGAYGNKDPRMVNGTAFLPKSALDSTINELYTALATPKDGTYPPELLAAEQAAKGLLVDDFAGMTQISAATAQRQAEIDAAVEASTMVDDFSGQKKSQMKASTYAASVEYLSSFGAEPVVASSLDKSASTKLASGTNNKPTTSTGTATWTDPNTGKAVVYQTQNNKTGTYADVVKQAEANWATYTPEQQQARLKARAADTAKKQADRG